MPLVNGPGRFRGPGSCLAQNCICSFAGIINILESTAVGEVHTARSEEPGNLIGFAPSEGPMDQAESFRGVPGSGSVEGDDIPDEVLDERINELVAGWAGSLFGGQATRAPQDFLTWQDLRAFNLLPGIAESSLEILIIVWLALTVWCCAGGAARRVKHAHGRKGFLTQITEWEGSHDPVVAAALAPIQAAWLLMAMPVHAVVWGLMRIFGTVWAVVQFVVVGVQGIIGSDEDWLNNNAKARESEEAPVASKKKKPKKQKANAKQRPVDKEEPVDVDEVGTAAEVRDMDPRRSAATVSEEEYMLRKMQEEEEEEAARMHAAVRMRERRESAFVEMIERKSSLDKERARAKEATDPPKPAKKEKKLRPAPVIVPSQPHLNGGGVHAALKSPTKGPPPLPCGPPPANQPKRWDGRPGPRPPLPAGPPPASATTNRFAALTPTSPTAEGVGRSRSSLDHRPHGGFGWNEEKEKRRQDELANSVLESLTSGAATPAAPPGYGTAGRHSQLTTPTGAAAFGGSMWSPSGTDGSEGGFSLFSGGSNPTSPTAGELNRRRNRFSH